MPRKTLVFWPTFVAVLAADHASKSAAVRLLAPRALPVSLAGDAVRLELVFNRGVGAGLLASADARPVFVATALLALVGLGLWYRATARNDAVRALALALVAAGAAGNLLDRLRTAAGVVDFITVSTGRLSSTFNVADVAIAGGAFLLAVLHWRGALPAPSAA